MILIKQEFDSNKMSAQIKQLEISISSEKGEVIKTIFFQEN